MKHYETVKIELLIVETADVISTSGYDPLGAFDGELDLVV